MSINNPFAKSIQKKPVQPAKQVQKTDSTRENVKRQLINALDKSKDNSISGLKITSEEIAKEIEEEIFKQNNNSSQKREYRDKIRKIEMRLKGPRNNFIREIIKKGKISINDFCNMNDKDLMDDNYFKKLDDGEKIEESQKDNNKNVIKNNFNPPKKFGMAKPPILKNFKIPKPVAPSVIQQPIIDSNNKDNIFEDNNKDHNEENKKDEQIKEQEIIKNNKDNKIVEPKQQKNNKIQSPSINNNNIVSMSNNDIFSSSQNLDDNVNNDINMHNINVPNDDNNIGEINISSKEKDNLNNIELTEGTDNGINNIKNEINAHNDFINSNINEKTDIKTEEIQEKKEETPKSSFDILQEKLKNMKECKDDGKKKEKNEKKSY